MWKVNFLLCFVEMWRGAVQQQVRRGCVASLAAGVLSRVPEDLWYAAWAEHAWREAHAEKARREAHLEDAWREALKEDQVREAANAADAGKVVEAGKMPLAQVKRQVSGG